MHLCSALPAVHSTAPCYRLSGVWCFSYYACVTCECVLPALNNARLQPHWLTFYMNACVLQESYGGEDAFFVSDAGGGAMGVADGVGGWQESGVNPAGEQQQRHVSCIVGAAPLYDTDCCLNISMSMFAMSQSHCIPLFFISYDRD